MANSLFEQFGNQTSTNPMSQFMSAFKQIQQTVRNPKQEVERLLQSGQMTQQQFNQLSQMANQFFGRK